MIPRKEKGLRTTKELQHRVITQNRAAAAPGFPDGGVVVCHNGGHGGFAMQGEHQLGVGLAFVDAEAQHRYKCSKSEKQGMSEGGLSV